MNKVIAATAGGIAAALVAAGVVTNQIVKPDVPFVGDSSCQTTLAPGQTFQAAMLAQTGECTVNVPAGNYPAQTLTGGTNSGVVTFAAQGQVNVAGGIAIGVSTSCTGAKHLAFDGITITGVGNGAAASTRCGADDITFRNLDAPSFNLSGGSNIQVLGGDYGPKVDDVNQLKGGVTGVLIDAAYLHNMTISDPAKHAECLHIWGAKNVEIRNSVFQNCTDRDIFAKREGGLVIDGITVEDNQFDVPMPGNVATVTCAPTCPRGGNSVQFSQSGGQITNSLITNNRALSAFSNEGQPGVVMNNNIFSGFVPPTNSGTNTKLTLVLPGDTTTTTTTTTEPTTTTETTTTTESTTTTDTTTDTTTTSPPPDSLPLTVVAQTATTVTVGWTPQGDQGYRFLVDGVSVSNTNDPARSSARFLRQAGAVIKVIARSEVASGTVVSP